LEGEGKRISFKSEFIEKRDSQSAVRIACSKLYLEYFWGGVWLALSALLRAKEPQNHLAPFF